MADDNFLQIASRCVTKKSRDYWDAVTDVSGWRVVWCCMIRYDDGYCRFYRLHHFVSPEGEKMFVDKRFFEDDILKKLKEFEPINP